MKSGFFVSCRKGKETKAYNELKTALNAIINEQSSDLVYKTLNMSDEINKEIKSLQKSSFSLYFTYKSILYISNSSSFSSSDLFYKLRERSVCLEYVHRIVPMDRFFTYNETVLTRIVSNLDINRSYKIDYEERLAQAGLKTKIFELIVTTLQSMKVSLTNPYYSITVQVLKTDVGISILENYTDLFNFSRSKNAENMLE